MRHTQRDILGVLLLIAGSLLAIALSAAAPEAGPGIAAWPRFAPPLLYAFMLRWPTAVPPIAVFGIGLAQDLAVGSIVGAGLLALMSGYFLFRGRIASLARAPIALQWLGFGPFVLLLFGIEWALSSLAQLAPLPSEAPLIQCCTTFLIFPAIAFLARPALLLGRRSALLG